jgi:hypothetical protein
VGAIFVDGCAEEEEEEEEEGRRPEGKWELGRFIYM